MSLFPTTKTVPLDKDLGVVDAKPNILGTQPREQLSVVLDTIDQKLYQEQQNRIAADTAETTRAEAAETNLQNEITAETSRAEAAELSEQNARIAAITAEALARSTQDTHLQSEIDGERSPLRLSATGTNTSINIASSLANRIDTNGNTVGQLGVPNGALISDFLGASIDFAAGTISYTGGTPSNSTFTPINFASAPGQFGKYVLVLIPSIPNTILVFSGTTFGASAALAPTPAFSGGVPIGVIAVQDNGSGGSGTISNVLQSSITQFVAAGSGGSGNGSGSPLDIQPEENWVYYTRSDFSVDKNKFVASTTGTDQSLGLGKIILNSGNIFTSKDLTGQQLWDDAYSINNAQVRLLYNSGKIDKTPLISVSEDGGNSWNSAIVSLPSSDGNLVLGDITFPSSVNPLFNGGVNAGSVVQGNRIAAIVSLPYRASITSFQMYIGTSATSGTITGKIYSVSSGTPQVVVAASSQTYNAGSDIGISKSYISFTLQAPYTIQANTTYAFVAEGSGLNANINTEIVTSAPSYSAGSSSYGSGWVASASNIPYKAFGSGADLRIKVTSSTNGSELAGFGVDYVLDIPTAITDIITLSKIAYMYDAIVGSPSQVQLGIAGYSTINSAISAVTSHGRILVLSGSYNENVNVNKSVTIEGMGYSSQISGALSFSAASSFSSVEKLRIGNAIMFDPAATGIFLDRCWQANGYTIVDINGGNSKRVAQE